MPTTSASVIEALVDAITGGTDNTTSIGRYRTQSQIARFMAQCNFDTVQKDIDRGQRSAETNLADAVTAACSLVESVRRSILVELDLPLPAKRDIGLLCVVQEPLGLSPGRTDLPDEIANDVRQILSGVTSAIKGIGALRTHGGDAHGRQKGFRRLDARIARLALHSSSAASLFLIETWERKMQRSLPKVEQ